MFACIFMIHAQLHKFLTEDTKELVVKGARCTIFITMLMQDVDDHSFSSTL